jgi:hypothetical protein
MPASQAAASQLFSTILPKDIRDLENEGLIQVGRCVQLFEQKLPQEAHQVLLERLMSLFRSDNLELKLSSALLLIRFDPSAEFLGSVRDLFQTVSDRLEASNVVSVVRLMKAVGVDAADPLWILMANYVEQHVCQIVATAEWSTNFSLTRLFSAFSSRCPQHPVCRALLEKIVSLSRRFRYADFSMLCSSLNELDARHTIDGDVFTRFLTAAQLYPLIVDPHQLSAVLSSMSRIFLRKLCRDAHLGLRDIDDVEGLMDEYALKCASSLTACLSPDSAFYREYSAIAEVAFSLEHTSRRRFREAFRQLAAFVRENATKMPPRAIALITGVLYRSQELTPETAEVLSRRIEEILGEFNIHELSHIALAFGPERSWRRRVANFAKEKLASDTPIGTRWNLMIAFPNDSTFSFAPTVDGLTPFQLSDLLPLDCSAALRSFLVNESLQRLRGPLTLTENVVENIVRCGSRNLIDASKERIQSGFLLQDSPPSLTARALKLCRFGLFAPVDEAGALLAAKRISASEYGFLHAVSALTDAFPRPGEPTKDFIRAGGYDLAKLPGKGRRKIMLLRLFLRVVTPLGPEVVSYDVQNALVEASKGVNQFTAEDRASLLEIGERMFVPFSPALRTALSGAELYEPEQSTHRRFLKKTPQAPAHDQKTIELQSKRPISEDVLELAMLPTVATAPEVKPKRTLRIGGSRPGTKDKPVGRKQKATPKSKSTRRKVKKIRKTGKSSGRQKTTRSRR